MKKKRYVYTNEGKNRREIDSLISTAQFTLVTNMETYLGWHESLNVT